MTAEYNITRGFGWKMHEAQDIPLVLLVDASALAMRWVLVRQAGDSAIVLEKTRTGAFENTEITGANLLATVHVDAGDYAGLEAGVWYYELWDTTNSRLLLFGDVYLGHGIAPA